MVSTDQEPSRTGLIDLDRTKRILAEVWGPQEGWVFLPHRVDGYWVEGPAWAYGGTTEFMPELDTDGDCYFSPLLFVGQRRLTQFALPTHCLWSDLDTSDPRKNRLRPSIAWETTGGDIPHYQAIWLLDNEIPALDAADLSKRIAYGEPGADRSGWDVTQVLRLPGTYNHKHDPAHLINILWAERRYYQVTAVEGAYPAVPQDALPAVPDMAASVTDVEEAWGRLPIGVRHSLTRPTDGADRSAQLYMRAIRLIEMGITPEVTIGLLQRSSWNKFRGRSDESRRLASVVSQAMAAVDRRRSISKTK